jgi:hypothetical protein
LQKLRHHFDAQPRQLWRPHIFQSFPRQERLRHRLKFVRRNARNFRRVMQPLLIFFKATFLVLLSTAARAWIIASDFRRGSAQRAIGMNHAINLLRQKVKRLGAEFLDEVFQYGLNAIRGRRSALILQNVLQALVSGDLRQRK